MAMIKTENRRGRLVVIFFFNSLFTFLFIIIGNVLPLVREVNISLSYDLSCSRYTKVTSFYEHDPENDLLDIRSRKYGELPGGTN